MTWTVLEYNVLPALLFVPILFILMFFSTIKQSVNLKKRLFIVCLYTGSLGFSLSFVLPLYEPLRYSYTFVPIAFFCLAFIGFVGCLILNTNPFDTKTPLFPPKPPKKTTTTHTQTVSLEEEQPFLQMEAKAHQLMHSLLVKLGHPNQLFKGVQLETTNNRTVTYPFIVTNPQGLFLIYPCNWSGDIFFYDSYTTKRLTSITDTIDYVRLISFQETFLRKLLDTIGMQDAPIKTIICTTNPAANPHGQPTTYVYTTLSHLTEYITTTRLTTSPLSTTALSDIEQAIELNRSKK